jgi:hypothetical protein
MSPGQDADLSDDLSLHDYEEVAGAKSGLSFRLGSRAGAMPAGAPPGVIAQYGDFGYNPSRGSPLYAIAHNVAQAVERLAPGVLLLRIALAREAQIGRHKCPRIIGYITWIGPSFPALSAPYAGVKAHNRC